MNLPEGTTHINCRNNEAYKLDRGKVYHWSVAMWKEIPGSWELTPGKWKPAIATKKDLKGLPFKEVHHKEHH